MWGTCSWKFSIHWNDEDVLFKFQLCEVKYVYSKSFIKWGTWVKWGTCSQKIKFIEAKYMYKEDSIRCSIVYVLKNLL